MCLSLDFEQDCIVGGERMCACVCQEKKNCGGLTEYIEMEVLVQNSVEKRGGCLAEILNKNKLCLSETLVKREACGCHLRQFLFCFCENFTIGISAYVLCKFSAKVWTRTFSSPHSPVLVKVLDTQAGQNFWTFMSYSLTHFRSKILDNHLLPFLPKVFGQASISNQHATSFVQIFGAAQRFSAPVF